MSCVVIMTHFCARPTFGKGKSFVQSFFFSYCCITWNETKNMSDTGAVFLSAIHLLLQNLARICNVKRIHRNMLSRTYSNSSAQYTLSSKVPKGTSRLTSFCFWSIWIHNSACATFLDWGPCIWPIPEIIYSRVQLLYALLNIYKVRSDTTDMEDVNASMLQL